MLINIDLTGPLFEAIFVHLKFEFAMSKLKEGDLAPVIEAVDQNGDRISLEEYRGKKVVLYFYPKDNTPGCTAESCDLRDNYSRFREQGFVEKIIEKVKTKEHSQQIFTELSH